MRPLQFAIENHFM